MKVFMTFDGGPAVRELHDTGAEVRVDLDENDVMVGLKVTGALRVELDGRIVGED